MGEERKNPKNASEPVLVRYIILCDTYFALSTNHASGVQCRRICLRYITLAIYFTLPSRCGVRNTSCTPTEGHPTCICLLSVAKEMYGSARKKRMAMV